MIAPVPELPRNDLLADQFDLLADLMELEGGDGFRISAYRKAAARIRETWIILDANLNSLRPRSVSGRYCR